jgi:acyl dehydratase
MTPPTRPPPTIPPPRIWTRSYTPADVALYAIAVGAGNDPHDLADFALAVEEDLQPLPTFGTALGWDNDWVHALGIDVRLVLHTHQQVRVHRPLPPSANVRIEARVARVYDRGAGAPAVFVHETDISDAATNAVYCSSVLTALAHGAGGFGGEPPPRHQPAEAFAATSHGAHLTATSPNQALLYRLTGDRNPLHVRPEVAAAAGFAAPLLHGLCSFGIACRAVVTRACGGDPRRIREFEARFTAPAHPGQRLATHLEWNIGEARLRIRCEDEGQTALATGRALFFQDSAGMSVQ